jgi:hypothetical protein
MTYLQHVECIYCVVLFWGDKGHEKWARVDWVFTEVDQNLYVTHMGCRDKYTTKTN